MRYLLLLLLLASCATKKEAPEVTLPPSEPPELGVYPVCDNGYLVGINLATTGPGVWRLRISEDVCKGHI